jgi:CO/xanthine dehydrogenase FAD-binding subunit
VRLASFDYLRPTSISEALDMANLQEDAMFLAGGHALLPDSVLPGAGAVATRAVRAEAQLVGSPLTPEAIEAAANAANDGIEFIGDEFGSAAYLAELVPIYLKRALSQLANPSTRH